MARRRPNWEVVISTTTTTGLAVARRTYPDLVTFYAPLDFSWSTRRAMARIRPTVLALVELELWPNLIRAAKRSGAKVAIINARLSIRSYRGYRSLAARCEPTFAGSTSSRPRTPSTPAIRRAGSSARAGQRHRLGQVRRTGKRSEQRQDPRAPQGAGALALRPGLRGRQHDGRRGGRGAGGLPGGSAQHPSLRLVLVPRHAERFDERGRVAGTAGRDGGPPEPACKGPSAARRQAAHLPSS